MLNINNALNNAIAVVVVILILSLVVQSVQSVAKKLFKIKSRQIEESLVDLFRNVLNKPPAKLGWFGRLVDHSPVTRFLFEWRSDKAKKAGVEGIYKNVMDGFKDIGRLAQSGQQMLDSIAKDDLLKIMEKVPITGVLPKFGPSVAAAFAHIKTLETDIKNLRDAAQSGAASAQFASMSAEYASIEVALRPLFNDVQSIINANKVTVDGYPPAEALPEGSPTPALLVHDLMALRMIKIEDVLKLLGEVQTKLSAASATVSAGDPAGSALANLAKGLGNIASDITALRQQLDAATAPFQAKVNEVEKWYDIVMQSFEERYNRSMKTWAIVIAFLIVVLLNANFFNIYRSIASNPAMSSLLVEKGPEILKIYAERNPPVQTPPTTTTTTPPTTAAIPGAPATTTTTPVTAQEEKKLTPDEEKKKVQDELRAGWKQVVDDANLYIGIGFKPLNWPEVKHWLTGLKFDDDPKPGDNPASPAWGERRTHDLKVLLGWIIMTMLLSIGAPFWQDTLESLFGVKNLLRKKGDIKNVETESGTGQPKT